MVTVRGHVRLSSFGFILLGLCVQDSVGSGRSGRLLSNPLGLFGHSSCVVPGSSASGLCYNELECLANGGEIQGYCSPSALGACCVFSSNKCGKTVTQQVSYFTNPSYPHEDKKPIACLLKIQPSSGVCYVQLDYEDLVISSVNGKCAYDSISILRSPEGPSGRICGDKSGYGTLTRVEPGKEIGISALIQTGNYKWNIRITMIGCDSVPDDVPREPECGIAGDIASGGGRVRALGLSGRGSIVKRKIRKLRTKRSMNEEVCLKPHYKELCDLARAARNVHKDGNYSVPPVVSHLDQKKYLGEVFQPSFTARSTFCESKFKQIQPRPKIYDGFEAPVGSFPWMASLQYKSKHFCGGTLISQQWVLTVAHCPDFPNVPNFISELKVSLGDHNLFSVDEADNILLGVAKILNYPVYDQAGYNGDLALLKLDKPVSYSRHIRPVCLPINNIDTFEKQIGVATGWGKMENGDLPETLRYVELNIVPNISCVANLGVVNIEITDKMICTFKGPTGTETTCTGDSGGPLMVRRSGRFVLVGATSFSLVDCQSPFPNVFSRISSFLDWISVAVKDFGTS